MPLFRFRYGSINIPDSVPPTRTLTINGTTYDLSADRTWTIGGSGTVTSVAMTVPTGLAISGSPITTSGTLALTFASGYSIPTDANQTNWTTAYGWGNHASAGYLTTSVAASTYLTIANASSTYLTIANASSTYLTIANASSTYVPQSRTLTINGTSFDLSANRSWTVTATATPGGSNGQVQYNNTGALGGASNVEIASGNLAIVDSTFPSAPASGRNVIFTDAMSNRQMFASIGPDGFHYDFQPSLFGQSTVLWLPGTGTTLSINWASSYTARNSGTGAAQNSSITPTSTNAVTSLIRAQFGTGTTATGASGIQTTLPVAWLGNASGLGGFFFFARFALEATSGTYRLFVGLSANNATLAGEPSALASSLGIILDSTDTTFQYLMRSSTTPTKINTTITPSTTTVYDFYMYSAPNSQLVHYELRNAVTNAVLSTSNNQNTNIPASTQFFYMQAHIMSATGTTSKVLSLNKMYLETNV